MKLNFSAKTDTGRVRKENQDSYGISQGKNIYFLCDGMGGGAAGDFASRCAVEVILKAVEFLKPADLEQVLSKTNTPGNYSPEILTVVAAIRIANRALSYLASEFPKLTGMGTTVSVVYFDPLRNIMHIFHVGDSRVYRMRGVNFELLTKDHSKVNELLEQGKMTEEEVSTAEIQSMITRALGTAPKVRVDYRCEYALEGDLFVMCTDGLNGEISDEEIKAIVSSNRTNVNMMAPALVDAANNAAGRDNTTVIALSVYDDKTAKLPPYDSRPGKVVTFEEETPDEVKAEDRIVKKLLRDAKIKVPKSADERSLVGNPIVIGVILACVVAMIGLLLPKCAKPKTYEKPFVNLAGTITGLRVDIREPIQEQVAIYRKTEDSIQRLQIIQDWHRESETLAVPLKNVELSVTDGKEMKINEKSGVAPLNIKTPRGLFTLKVNYPKYMIVNEKVGAKDGIVVAVEPAQAFTPVILIMIPTE